MPGCRPYDRGWSKPGDFTCSSFSCCKIWQVCIKRCTSWRIRDHESKLHTLWNVSSTPKWPPIALLCSACKTASCASRWLPNHIFIWWWITPRAKVQPSSFGLCNESSCNIFCAYGSFSYPSTTVSSQHSWTTVTLCSCSSCSCHDNALAAAFVSSICKWCDTETRAVEKAFCCNGVAPQWLLKCTKLRWYLWMKNSPAWKCDFHLFTTIKIAKNSLS